ncbi:DoxX family protein [Lentzea sp. NBRC 102530]|uniref:DoxX family protein n=1 Tax=Lentzea sp. NBRC 102530 TaxID=3032201 RepID=UPI002552ADFD|nr:DoxX family protein [Lentzea sp. NBRC 102530]
MNVLLWVLQGVMAFLTIPSGVMTVLDPDRVHLHGRWVQVGDRAVAVVRGLASVACGTALIVPGLIGKATVLTPIAALLLVAPACYFPARQFGAGEIGPGRWVLGTIWLAFPPVFVAWARFGPYPL